MRYAGSRWPAEIDDQPTDGRWGRREFMRTNCQHGSEIRSCSITKARKEVTRKVYKYQHTKFPKTKEEYELKAFRGLDLKEKKINSFVSCVPRFY